MNRAVIRNFAVWAGRKLHADFRAAGEAAGIPAQEAAEAADAWFLRLAAIRYMEIAGLLPAGGRILSSSDPEEALPDLVRNPFSGGLRYSHKEETEIRRLMAAEETDSLFVYLLIRLGRKLHIALPGLFDGPKEQEERLAALRITDRGGVVSHLVKDIPEEDLLTGGVGLLYRYYRSGRIEEVRAGQAEAALGDLREAERPLPPERLVRLLVKKSLGRAVCEAEDLRELTVLDPWMFTGEFLGCAFDLLLAEYEDRGFRPEEAARYILERNLFGLDTDPQAAGAAYFTLMMKTARISPGLLESGIRPNLLSYRAKGEVTEELKAFICGENEALAASLQSLLLDLRAGEQLGSLIRIREKIPPELTARLTEIGSEFTGDLFAQYHQRLVQDTVRPLVRAAEILSGRFDAVLSCPPLLLPEREGTALSAAFPEQDPQCGQEIGAAAAARAAELARPGGYLALVTIRELLLQPALEAPRKLLLQREITECWDLGEDSFGDPVSDRIAALAFVQRMRAPGDRRGDWFDLTGGRTPEEKERLLFGGRNAFSVSQKQFYDLPGMVCAYYLPEELCRKYASMKTLRQFALPERGAELRAEDPAELWILAYLTSKAYRTLRRVPDPGLSGGEEAELQTVVPGLSLPEREEAGRLFREREALLREDAALFEQSRDFRADPLFLTGEQSLPEAYRELRRECHARFLRLRRTEEEINRLFIGACGMEQALSPFVEEAEVAAHRICGAGEAPLPGSGRMLTRGDLSRNFLSWAVGCLFGRYSPDAPGVVYDGGVWDNRKYRTVKPDPDNCLLVSGGGLFRDDLTGKLERFLAALFGERELAENLVFLAEGLTEEEDAPVTAEDAEAVLRRYFMEEFYPDHRRRYGEEPIYGLHDSGKEGAFRCLVYLCRTPGETPAVLRRTASRIFGVLQKQADRSEKAERMEKDPKKKAHLHRINGTLRSQLAELETDLARIRSLPQRR